LIILFITSMYEIPTSCGLLIDFEHGIPADWYLSFEGAGSPSKNPHQGQQSMMLGPVIDQKHPAEASIKLDYPAYVEFWWNKSEDFDSMSDLILIYDNKSLVYDSAKWKNGWGVEEVELDKNLLLKFRYISSSTHPDSIAWIDDINITYKFNPPNINLIYPERNQTIQLDKFNSILFTYELPSIQGFGNFKTYLSRENLNESTIHQLPSLNETIISFLYKIGQPGKYTWYVACEGNGGVIYRSETRYFTLNVPPMSIDVITPKNICIDETFHIEVIMNSSEYIYGVKSLKVECNNSGFRLIDLRGEGFFQYLYLNSSQSIYQSMSPTKEDSGSLDISYMFSIGSDSGSIVVTVDDIVLMTANGEKRIEPVVVQIDIPKKFSLWMRKEYENEHPNDEMNINSLYECSC